MTATPLTVIGLGAMGRALANAFLTAGHPTTVWNRTPGRAADLVERGATEAPTLAAAIQQSPLVVMCVLDRAAADDVLDRAGEGLRGVTIVNLTSATPQDARAIADRVTSAGARYLDGTIMVPTTMVGTADSYVLYSGDGTAFTEHEAALRALGGEAELLGDDAGLAATYDLAMLDIFFNGMTAFLHAAALVGSDGVSAKAFLPYADRMLALLEATFVGLADDVDRGEHPGAEDNLEMEAAFLDHIISASAARGLDASVPTVTRQLIAAAIGNGHGRDGFSRVIDVLRRPAPRGSLSTSSR